MAHTLLRKGKIVHYLIFSHSPVRRLAILVFIFSLFSPFPTSAQTSDYEFLYRVQWGNVNLGQSVAQWRFTDTQVTMEGMSVPKGPFSTFSDFEGRVSFTAHKNSDGWQADYLRLHSTDGEESWTAETNWIDGGKKAETQNTPEADLEEVFPLTDDMKENVTAPFAAMLEMLDRLEQGEPCEGRFDIYDGWRSAELRFKDLGKINLESDRPWSYSGTAIICGMLSTPKGGHRKKSRFRSKNPRFEDIKAYIGKHPSGKLVPVRIEVDIPVGKLTARLDMTQ